MRLTLEERLKIAKLHIYEDVPIAQLARDFNADTGRVKYYTSHIKERLEELHLIY